MFKTPGRHIGDTWYFSEGDRAHLFYLTCPNTRPRHKCWDIGHAWSADMVHWTDEGVVLSPGRTGEWDGVTLATGSVVRFGGQYYMSYTGNFAGPVPAAGLAVSGDLFRWEKWRGNPVTRCDGRLYSAGPNIAWKQPLWRDPFLYVEEGVAYQLITAARPDMPPGVSGTVGVARSADMMSWELLPPLDVPAIAQDLECPKLHKVGDRYYLTVSISRAIAGPALLSRQPAGMPVDTAFSLVSDSLMGPYRLHGSGRILEDHRHGFPYACEPVLFRDRYYLMGTLWDDAAGDAVTDPIPLVATPEGWKAE